MAATLTLPITTDRTVWWVGGSVQVPGLAQGTRVALTANGHALAIAVADELGILRFFGNAAEIPVGLFEYCRLTLEIEGAFPASAGVYSAPIISTKNKTYGPVAALIPVWVVSQQWVPRDIQKLEASNLEFNQLHHNNALLCAHGAVALRWHR